MEQDDKKRKTILLVEDDNVLRDTLADRLKVKFNILEAGSGEKGWQVIQDSKPDLVLLDLLLPSESGYDLLEHVRASGDPQIAQTKVVVLSNLSASEDIERAKKYKISNFVLKSMASLDDVEEKIQDALKGIVI